MAYFDSVYFMYRCNRNFANGFIIIIYLKKLLRFDAGYSLMRDRQIKRPTLLNTKSVFFMVDKNINIKNARIKFSRLPRCRKRKSTKNHRLTFPRKGFLVTFLPKKVTLAYSVIPKESQRTTTDKSSRIKFSCLLLFQKK